MMADSMLDSVASRSARLGVLLNVTVAEETPDLERLLLDTARIVSANSRLLPLAASWLARYASHVNVARLTRLISAELQAEYRPNLGLLLELSEQFSRPEKSLFALAVKACGANSEGCPLADVERENPVYRRLAEKRASALSRKWGRWTIEMAPKSSAMRPPEWIAQQNPSLIRTANSDPSNRRS